MSALLHGYQHHKFFSTPNHSRWFGVNYYLAVATRSRSSTSAMSTVKATRSMANPPFPFAPCPERIGGRVTVQRNTHTHEGKTARLFSGVNLVFSAYKAF